MSKIILGLDPGEKNFAFSVLLYDEASHSIDVLEVGLIANTLPKVEWEISMACRPFIREFRRLLKRIQPQELVVERFMNRGPLGAALTEKINILIGLLIAHALRKNVECYCYSAATWKNDVNPVVEITDLYKRVSKTIRDYNKATTKREYKQVKNVKKKRSKKKLVKTSKINWSADKVKKLLSMVPHTTDATIIPIKSIIDRQPKQEKRRVKLTILNMMRLESNISGAIIKKGLDEL